MWGLPKYRFVWEVIQQNLFNMVFNLSNEGCLKMKNRIETFRKATENYAHIITYVEVTRDIIGEIY